MSGGGAAVEFAGVSVTHPGGAGPALSQITFAVAAGERVALIGNNGSGKTTLLRAAVGLVPFTGTIRVCGRDLHAGSLADIRREVGFLFATPDDQILFPNVLDDVSFALRGRGAKAVEASQAARAVLEELRAGHLSGRAPHELSHGERLRVALAGALVARPPLLLLDEPSSALDPPGKILLGELLRRNSAAILMATHDLQFAQEVCGRSLTLDGGRLSFGEPEGDSLRCLSR
jgi:cobalt/nickel transport system ATP-binding protein